MKHKRKLKDLLDTSETTPRTPGAEKTRSKF
jgi:hypothetical protein